MSVGQIGGAIVGGILGSFSGNPWLGAQIGMSIGGYLDPPDGPTTEGPRLSDTRYQSASYGVFLSRSYGMTAGAGNVLWLENDEYKHVRTKTKSGGKGASKTATITHAYYATFALSLDDTRSKGAPLGGIRRIWLGGRLWYDAGSSDPDTIAASNAAATGFAFYPGSDTQLPDPRMQAALGVGNTSGWPGLAYIVFYDLALEKYGNSLAGVQAKVEIFASGTYEYYKVTVRDLPPVNKVWRSPFAWSGSLLMAINASGSAVMTSPDGVDWTLKTLPYSGTWYPAVTNGDRFAAPYYAAYDAGGGIYLSLDDGDSWTRTLPGTATYGWTHVIWCGTFFLAAGNNRFATSADGVTWVTQASHGYGAHIGDSLAWNGSMVMALFNNWALTSPDGIIWTPRAFRPASESYVWLLTKGSLFLAMSNTGYGTRSTTDGISWTAYATPIGNPQGACVDDDNFVIAFPFGFWVSPTGGAWTQYTPVLPGSQGWALGFNGSIIAALMGGSQYGAATIQPKILHPAGTDLATIVAAESLQSTALTPADIDVTALTPLVTGYRVGRLGPIRSGLEQLRDAWPFDIRMNGYQIEFVMRGGGSVVTIPAADLDARVEGAEPGVQITEPREMDSQLPRVLWVNHIDVSREYDPGAQYAERLNSSAVNVVSIELPIVMTPTEAAGKAQVLLRVKWLERYDLTFNLPPTYRALQPADVVALTAPDAVHSVRLTRINNTSDGRVECAGKLANATVYTPTAVGAAGQSTGVTTIPLNGPSIYHLLDIPLLHDAQAASGFPLAMCGTKSGWRGGVLLQSADAGGSWAEIAEVPPPGSTFGVASNAIGAVESRLMDTASRLTVVLTSGDLFDCTELALLGGVNHFAYGADGRWEIIAAKTCALQSGSTYILSGLLRGRYGSEQYMGSHLAGDVVVLLDPDELAMVSMASSTIGVSRDYLGVSVGADISSDVSRAFAYRAVNLMPLSPIALTGHRDPTSGDWRLIWMRRTRVGSEWRDYVDAELGESVEQYQIDVCSDGTFATVKRTLVVSQPLADYLSTDQAADFGGDQATLYLRIVQMSTAVGRGYPLLATITR